MFSQFFGKYLLDTGKITDDQFNSCMEYIKANRVQLGLIAETEGMLTRTQANELNYLQMQTDKLFGDLAVEKGYLTTSDITYLLGRQGNPYLIFFPFSGCLPGIFQKVSKQNSKICVLHLDLLRQVCRALKPDLMPAAQRLIIF